MNMLVEAPPSAAMPLSEVRAALDCARPVCTVYARSHAEHLLQVYAGLYALHGAGHIRLRQRFGEDALRERLGRPAIDGGIASRTLNGLLVDVEGAGLVFFDVRDGENFHEEILDRVLLYAKRSFRRSAYRAQRDKFVPLGLNYSVSLARATRLELVKSLAQLDGSALALKRLLVSLARVVPAVGAALGVPTVESFYGAPSLARPARCIFYARTWEPAEVGGAPEAVRALNDTRAACIRALRENFGDRFSGGFSRSARACSDYADCVVDAATSTRRPEYLRRLKSYPVCVSTTGLFESIGWKFGEYVALARAIVSEPVRFELPGPIAAGDNYLEFETPQGCVAGVAKLMDDENARWRMMENNRRYHLEYGTPDALVGRVLHAALRRSGRDST